MIYKQRGRLLKIVMNKVRNILIGEKMKMCVFRLYFAGY